MMDGNTNKRQCFDLVDPPSAWCTPVVASTHPVTASSSQLPLFTMPVSPDIPLPPREEKYMKYRDARFPLAGLFREEGGIREWMKKNKERT